MIEHPIVRISRYEDALPVEWGVIRNIPGYPGYAATDKGWIVSYKYKLPRILRDSIDKSTSCHRVSVWVDGLPFTRSVHQLVARAFHGEPGRGQEVNHMDGDRNNNTPQNLEWATRKENIVHAVKNGLHKSFSGEDNKNSKLTARDVLKIRSLYRIARRPEVAEAFGVTESAIQHIWRRRTWRNL